MSLPNRRLIGVSTEVRERYMETLQFAAIVAVALIVFHGLEDLLGIGGEGLVLRSIVFGICFSLTGVCSVVLLEIASRENSLLGRVGRWLHRRSAPMRDRVVDAWRTVVNTKRALVELGVDVGFLVFGLLVWALQCVICSAVIWLLFHDLRQIGVSGIPDLSLAQYMCAGTLSVLFSETLIDRVRDIIAHLAKEIPLPTVVYLRRVKAEWLQQRARSANRSRSVC